MDLKDCYDTIEIKDLKIAKKIIQFLIFNDLDDNK